MTFFQLAVRYLLRKKAKTVLLFLVFVLIGSLILGALMLLRTAASSKKAILEKTNAGVVAETGDPEALITERQVQTAFALDNVAWVNRFAHHSAALPGISPLTQNESEEEENTNFVVFTYDDLQNDSPFFEQRYRLLLGTLITPQTQRAAVINSLLAEWNELQVGSTIHLTAADGEAVPVRIVGLFFSGGERQQSDATLAVNRIENQIFVDHGTYQRLFPDDGYEKVAFYTKDPEALDALCEGLRAVFPGTVQLTTSDALFQRAKGPLEQLLRIVRLMLILTFITGTAILAILLCMWMRTRKREMAVFISIGKTKTGILLQVLFEAYAVFLASLLASCGGGVLIAWLLQKALAQKQTAEMGFELFLRPWDLAMLLAMGSCIVLIAVGISVFPALRANPKDTMSKMEG